MKALIVNPLTLSAAFGLRVLVNEEAVALGLQRTGRIVTFAAALMVIANWWAPRPLARFLPA